MPLAGKANYLSNKILNLLGDATLTAPATYYLALFTVMPAADGTGGTECASAGSYARVAITANTTNFPTTTTESVANGAAFAFPQASADWMTAANIVGWGLYDASTSGNLWYAGPVTVPAPVLSGQTATFPIGDLTITEA
jgi:expansin (peptidoglycan-binding protein)